VSQGIPVGGASRDDIEGGNGLGKDIGQQPLAKIGPQAFSWVAGNLGTLIDHLPAQSLELPEKRLFDFGIFAHGVGLAAAR